MITDPILQVKTWLSSFIIEYKICPFAQRVYEETESIHYKLVKSNDTGECLETMFAECIRLDRQPEIETTLLIYPNHFQKFEDFLDFLSLAESLLTEQNYSGTYQLASFHPDYCFENEDSNDPANYTNRSPYPIIHLLREASLTLATDSYPNPEFIPERNIKLLREMGLEKIQSILDAGST